MATRMERSILHPKHSEGNSAAAHAASTSLTRQEEAAQREAIAVAAYYLSEQRGFEPGHELEDWVKAEMQLQAAALH